MFVLQRCHIRSYIVILIGSLLICIIINHLLFQYAYLARYDYEPSNEQNNCLLLCMAI